MLTSWICKCAYLSSPCKHKHQRLWLSLLILIQWPSCGSQSITMPYLFTQWLSEHLKLAKIVVVSMFGSIKDEWTFSTLAFIKDKLHNMLGLHLDTIVYMFAQEFCIQENFPHQETIIAWKDQKVQIGAISWQVSFFSQHKIQVFMFP